MGSAIIKVVNGVHRRQLILGFVDDNLKWVLPEYGLL